MAQMVKNLPAVQEILGQENPLEKRMATTPVFLSGEFHGQRSLVGYCLLQRVGHDLVANIFIHTYIHMCMVCQWTIHISPFMINSILCI